ncbi:hypothetical protein CEXT_605211 [Caerostris extrusa]|uniref:Uncharacterized protein n=1 Tax=Caerostris extrusa TaxID=172846 RepID=A0AAV4QEC4_CAEEX|nr:hypothetical protein CEXT_605211 [Caerostris extrusa]
MQALKPSRPEARLVPALLSDHVGLLAAGSRHQLHILFQGSVTSTFAITRVEPVISNLEEELSRKKSRSLLSPQEDRLSRSASGSG